MGGIRGWVVRSGVGWHHGTGQSSVALSAPFQVPCSKRLQAVPPLPVCIPPTCNSPNSLSISMNSGSLRMRRLARLRWYVMMRGMTSRGLGTGRPGGGGGRGGQGPLARLSWCEAFMFHRGAIQMCRQAFMALVVGPTGVAVLNCTAWWPHRTAGR